ncbi:MAG TPA: MBL fold metallo-hydrolase [Acidimicrobiia bacterium]|jgi:glyoxylase-like metal-dependent hydrolase (beta-lactamase superfamily II)|nr:MBL fold metallo-hydrolase [Acidimicrobiia bacterium]
MRIDRVLANNPGPFTGTGTNTWVLGDEEGSVVVIDPGPVDSKHATAIMEMVGERRPVAVLVTHTHSDHAPLANPLAGDLGVPAVGYAPGPSFQPEIRLLEGARFDVGTLALEVIYTPGHSDDHLCFRVDNLLFTGDHIMGGSSVMVEKMGPYLASLEKLRGTGLEHLYPGHGEEMDNPDEVIEWYLAHRRQRHEQIYQAISDGADTVSDIVEVVYADVDSSLHPLAAKSVEAHVALMREEDRIALEDDRLVPVLP